MAEKISGLLTKDYIHLGLVKKDATALQNGLVDYIKAIRYCCFNFPIHIVPILY